MTGRGGIEENKRINPRRLPPFLPPERDKYNSHPGGQAREVYGVQNWRYARRHPSREDRGPENGSLSGIQGWAVIGDDSPARMGARPSPWLVGWTWNWMGLVLGG
uniref:Uncharacterized protein n=1 Tax=Coccidioides posadasii RMSCC 3488 TaxID=454284 RepID=A0A0J6FUZ6_COCPO|nr:hypothetical protein CPAG_09272 [Coccidioides posadasii RMSCC 3488]